MCESLKDNIQSAIDQVKIHHTFMTRMRQLAIGKNTPRLNENLKTLEILEKALTSVLNGQTFLIFLPADEFGYKLTTPFNVIQIRLDQKNLRNEQVDVLNNQQEPGVDY